jgi:hypothetical protein
VNGLGYFEIEEIINFDSFNLLNLVREDLWLSGLHVKETRRTLIWSLYKPPHGGGGDISSTVARIKENKREVNLLTS